MNLAAVALAALAMFALAFLVGLALCRAAAEGDRRMYADRDRDPDEHGTGWEG
jgi:hypothetical protein